MFHLLDFEDLDTCTFNVGKLISLGTVNAEEKYFCLKENLTKIVLGYC